MPEVAPRFKAGPRACPCGCGMVGPLRAKAWRDGLGPHVRGCPCRRCVGARQRPKASRRERKIAVAVGGERAPLSGALSGYDGSAGLWRWEETSQESIVRGVRRWWDSKAVRAKRARLWALSGVHRALVLSWDGKPRLVVMEYEDWVALVKEDVA